MIPPALLTRLRAHDVDAMLEVTSLGSRRGVKSDKTLRLYRNAFAKFLTFLAQRQVGVLDVTAYEAALYRDWLVQGHVNQKKTRKSGAGTPRQRGQMELSSVATYLAPVRGLYVALVAFEVMERNPWLTVHFDQPKNAPPPPYTDAEVEAMLRSLSHSMPYEQVLVLLGAHAGLRVEEAVTLRCGNVDFSAGTLRFTGKGRKEREVPMSGSLSGALALLRDRQQLDANAAGVKFDQDGSVLNLENEDAARYALEKITTRAKVPWRGYHSLRRNAGSWLLRETGSIQAVQQHLGHADISTSARYTHYVRDHEETVRKR